MRIVSLLPSATEILFDIGAGDDVVGVTFECDHPREARSRTVVSTSAMPDGLTPTEIDAFVAEAMRNGVDLYHLDAGALSGLDADLVVTQDLCAVCAVDVSVVDEALAHLGCTAQVLTVDPPRTLAMTHWSPLTGDADEPANYHHVRYDLEQLGEGRTRLTLTHGNSPSQEAADSMIETGWRPTLDAIKQLVEQ